MKLYAPKYYKNFKCIADQCKHSCCIGWEIDVDEDALNKYSSLSCDYAQKINNSIEYSETPHFILAENDRCPHLNKDGLCEIIKNVGEDHLCNICREHPRFYNFTNIGKEVGIGMSCEEACRLILENDSFDEIVSIGDIDGEPDIISFDSLVERKTAFDILKDEEYSFDEKIGWLYEYFDLYLEEELILDFLSRMEYLDDNHKELFSKFNLEIPDEKIHPKLERALAYFIYRHCTEAKDYDEFAISLSFSMLCTFLIASISDENNIEDMARIVSEEIEYNTDNVEMLKKSFIYEE